jgi:Cu/Ag efflux pump CusA
MMGGLIAGTLLTLAFVPALYALSFGVDRDEAQEETPSADASPLS